MRTYGRVTNPDGSKTWVEVLTTSAGDNSYVWLTTLIQVLKLNTGESPFFGKDGIPAKNSVITQTLPTFAVQQVQTQFSQYFSNLTITLITAIPTPTYQVNVVFFSGIPLELRVPT